MMKEMITLAGKNGSGKSSTANKVAEMLGYARFSTGDFMRQMAKDRGISLEEMGTLAENDPTIDMEIDENNIRMRDSSHVVIDSRLAFHFIPESFKVFLEVTPEIAAERILKDKATNPNRLHEAKASFSTKEEIVTSITQRLENERVRYFDRYGIKDHTDHANFDLVIDTAPYSIQEVADMIVTAYKTWLAQ